MRFLGRFLFIIFVAALLFSGATLALFSSWRNNRIATLDKGSKIADTIAGNIEFARSGKTGPFVLVFHGAPGGYDQALLLGESLSSHGYQVIAPSRPGYLRTPLSTGILPEDQADAMAALLDTLGIDKVAVLGFSAGTPAATQFAIRHPERVWGVILVSTLPKAYCPYVSSPRGLLGELMLHKSYSDTGSWLLVEESKHFPVTTVLRMLSWDTKIREQEKNKIAYAISKSPDQLAWFQKLLLTTAPMTVRQPGFINDMVLIRGMQKIAYNSIKTPLLVIHGDKDVDTPIADVKAAMTGLPNVDMVTVEDSGPIVWLGPNANSVNQKILTFLQTNAPQSQ
ncbi:MAG: alpha/beta hydrolase [Chthoniobacterales bacterium]